jgi:hypothetical protein
MQQCRATIRGKTLTEEQFKIRFAWMLPWAINLLTNPYQKFDLNMSDWFNFFNTSSIKRFNPPNTCTYSNYLKTKSCSFKFSGFQSLINTDISINIFIKDCPDFHTPALYLECEGKDCALITAPRFCSTQMDCDQSFTATKCMSLSNTHNVDFVQAYFTHKFNPIDSCGSTSLLVSDLQRIINAYTTQPPQQSICFWDIENLINTIDFQAWADKQYVVDGDSFTILDLIPWNPQNVNIPGTLEAESPSNNIFANWWFLFLLIFISWKL